MQDQPGGMEGARPAPLFKTYDVLVQNGTLSRKAARGTVGNTTVSILPDEQGLGDLEVAFLRKDKKGEDQLVRNPIMIHAGDEDIVEVADTLTRHLAGGTNAEKLLKLLEKKKRSDIREMLEYLREERKDASK